MSKRHILTGFIIGVFTSLIGIFSFLFFFTDEDVLTGIQKAKQLGSFGKIITLGAILNLPVFLILLKKNKEYTARGIILAVIILAIFTLFI
jgi:uncharacterized membrane protein